jgi:uncharacterized protein
MQISGRVVLITGASSGIGAATAKAMAHKGGRVVLLARNQAALNAVVAEIVAHGGEACSYRVDLADANAVDQVTRTIAREIGAPDILINNAGAGHYLFVDETSMAEAVQMMAVPYFAAFAVTRAFLPEMLRRNSGQIVNLTSPACYFAWPGATAYTVARWAMRGFTEALRADLYNSNIQVTLVVPGKVHSSYFEHNPGSEERIPGISRLYPTLTPEQVATAIVRAVEHNHREVILPFSLRLTVLMHRLLPHPIEWLLIRTGWRRAPQNAQRQIPSG